MNTVNPFCSHPIWSIAYAPDRAYLGVAFPPVANSPLWASPSDEKSLAHPHTLERVLMNYAG